MNALFPAILALCLLPAPAFAYLDPGTGTLVLQGIIAAFATLCVSITLAWHRLKSILSSIRARCGKHKRKG